MKTPNIIPYPLVLEQRSGVFTCTSETEVYVSENARHIADYLVGRFAPAMGFTLNIQPLASGQLPASGILLQLDATRQDLETEGYQLSVTSDRVLLSASTPEGLFYACQTLAQLLPESLDSKTAVSVGNWEIPAVEIQDKPRFAWRGGLLDVSRHYMPLAFIKRYIDLLAQYKYNIFHWHIVDDQGWRLEIKRFPKLTEHAAWRNENGSRYGGYYTQEDVREVVEYARQRSITVIPEIEMPGHTVAALSAYPELSCAGEPLDVETNWGIFKDVFCAGNDKAFEFLEQVLTEVFELFPGPYVHLGGDECPKNRWKTCSKCQTRMRQEGLETEEELQSYFMKRMGDFLQANNKQFFGWDEILEGGLAPNAKVMSWRSMDGGIAAAQQGHDVVMCPESHCYFDRYQSENWEKEPKTLEVNTVALDTVYQFNPVPDILTPQQAEHILGVQGNLWTEYVHTPEHAEYMLLPRLCALAEVAWSSVEHRDFERFLPRLASHCRRFEAAGVNYRQPDAE